ncbi:MAG: adenylosuccinate synthase [Phycisphaerae bacterium]|nr:adenylosuccinate synthase [Phycisphaerae bacterium]
MSVQNITIIGLQWGDEGKGKIVDALSGDCRYVVRFCGGANAGHTVIVGTEKYALHLIPSGILRTGVRNVIGNGVAFDPEVAVEEIEGLRSRGVEVGNENLAISSAANVVMPWHKLADRLNEAKLGAGKIGTTARGIGPLYSDKTTRTLAIRAGDLLDADVLAEKVARIVEVKNTVFSALYGHTEPIDAETVTGKYLDYGKRLGGMITDTGAVIRRAISEGSRVCFEGGQGSMLDIDHGTFPFVTSSSVTACGVPSGAGVPPKAVGCVVGIVKAYTSRVGAGPFPTEQDNEIGDCLREQGHEYGTTTGRPRRCGWFDATAVRYAADLSGVDELALMLLDVLSGFKTLRICTGYRVDGVDLGVFDSVASVMDRVECVYEDMPGWEEDITSAKKFSDLPANARAYVERISALVGRPVGLISVGPERGQTIPHETQLEGPGTE